MKLSDFKALSFDCYGTLIDWEKGLRAALESLANRVEESIDRGEILETYARYESQQETETPTKLYPELMATVYKRMSEEWRTPAAWDECVAFGRSVTEWPTYSDSAEALTYLKKHFKLIILSNVDNASFAISNSKLSVTFDAIYSAQDIGSYKPDDRNFQYLIENVAQLGIDKSELLHVAQSLYHDHEPANRHGLKSCWIDRQHGRDGSGATPLSVSTPLYDFRFCALSELAAAHRIEIANREIET